jgi:Icc-related predicted phosphoesterase
VTRLAAVGDIHVGEDCDGCVDLAGVNQDADVLLLAGDLTRVGSVDEARVLGQELSAVDVPVVAVLGNHDYQSNSQREVNFALTAAGARVLEGERLVVEIGTTTLGIAGTKGFGGGFAGACGSEFGEPEMKAFVHHTRLMAQRLEEQLRSLDTDYRVALLHYSPIEGTLEGERLEIYPFLGSYLLGEAIDRAGADLVLHGHAHRGVEKGTTPSGIPVRNVARPVIQHPYNVYVLGQDGPVGDGSRQTVTSHNFQVTATRSR